MRLVFLSIHHGVFNNLRFHYLIPSRKSFNILTQNASSTRCSSYSIFSLPTKKHQLDQIGRSIRPSEDQHKPDWVDFYLAGLPILHSLTRVSLHIPSVFFSSLQKIIYCTFGWQWKINFVCSINQFKQLSSQCCIKNQLTPTLNLSLFR